MMISVLFRHIDLKCISSTFRRFVFALSQVGTSAKELDHPDEVSPQLIIAVCSGISAVMPIKDDTNFWKTVQKELLATLVAIQEAERNHCQSDKYFEITVLEATAMAKIHLGLAMSLVLCPPMIDPMTISLTEHQFLHGIVSYLITFVYMCTTSFDLYFYLD